MLGFFIVPSDLVVYNYGVRWGKVVYNSNVVGDSGKLLYMSSEPV